MPAFNSAPTKSLVNLQQAGAAKTAGKPASPGEFSGTTGGIIAAAVWFGLITGAIEGIYWLLRQQVGGELVFLHPGFLWMAPATQLAYFALLGGVLAAIAWKTKTAGMLPFSVTLLSLIAWLNCVELFVPGLHYWSWIILSLGLATVTGRAFQKHTERCLTFARRANPVMLIGLAIFAAGQVGLSSYRESSAVAAVPTNPRENAPNVLLVVLDTVRADALALYGADRELAPNLTRLAETGVSFDAAYSTSSWTLPAHASMFTGKLPSQLSTDWMARLDDAEPTLAEKLAAEGWLTGGFVGNTFYCSNETGLNRGFTRYEGYRQDLAGFATCTALGRMFLHGNGPTQLGFHDRPARKRAPEINASFFSWIDEHPQRPFFAYVNYFDAHDPYFAPPEFDSSAEVGAEDLRLLRYWWSAHKEDLTDEQVRLLRTAYEDCLRGLDDQLGKLIDELDSRGQLDNTLIVVTADHGEHFGDHDLYLHGNSLYEPLIHVPLVVAWPGKIPAGKHVVAPVSLLGFSSTICELLDVDAPLPGTSWTSHWDENTAEPNLEAATASTAVISQITAPPRFPPCHGHSPVFDGAMTSARIGDWKYIYRDDGREELYNLKADPEELVNLIDELNSSAELRQLRDAVAESHGRK